MASRWGFVGLVLFTVTLFLFSSRVVARPLSASFKTHPIRTLTVQRNSFHDVTHSTPSEVSRRSPRLYLRSPKFDPKKILSVFSPSTPEQKQAKLAEKIAAAQARWAAEKEEQRVKALRKDSLTVVSCKCGSLKDRAVRRIQEAWKGDSRLHKFGQVQISVSDAGVATARYYNGDKVTDGGAVNYKL
ncbi:hypothetical protein CC1G_05487 [Coprinopsis cinerea okayama7|uniref:Uncharacterized protein n=1 Tax=Coprinopsis cinerea (strain Okayama-7 / 130 / ATCC MYA-4618 / FGSC 9003) TaxID=240176 RepID=A8P5G0_COPC7|nr:hypothetical protein CC1G_05487 [Coprinopsis cinerea okayama7\|eukprot:XP_001838934.1 hypothetical protein CC1G_05487 [Coprinopsis cinerea okayama7\